jgi:hypothetical protein
MGTISYDRDDDAPPPQELYDFALNNGLKVTQVTCFESPKDADTAMMFFAVTPEVPRLGERIRLENGRICIVNQVRWVVEKSQSGNLQFVKLVPNVVADLLQA